MLSETIQCYEELIKTFPEKQLKIPDVGQLLKNYNKIFDEKKAGKRRKLIPKGRVVFHNGFSYLRKHNPIYSTHRNRKSNQSV